MSARLLNSPVVLLALAFATWSGPAISPARAAEPVAFEVDTGASRVYIKVGITTKLGHEHGVEGNLKSGKLKPGDGGELIFDMTSFMADTPEARKRVGLENKKVSENEAKKVTEAMRAAA